MLPRMAVPLPKLEELVPPSELSIQAQRLIDYASRRAMPSRASIVEQFQSTFEMIGGIPRLALWADENPKEFFALYAKLLPATVKNEGIVPLRDRDIKTMSLQELQSFVLDEIQGLKDLARTNDALQEKLNESVVRHITRD